MNRKLLFATIVLLVPMVTGTRMEAAADGIYAGKNGTDTTYGWLFKLTFSGGGSTVPAVGVNYPIAIAIGPNGELFAGGGDAIIEFNGKRVTPFATGLNDPGGLAFDSNGYLFDSEQSTGEILKFTPERKPFLPAD